MEDDLKFDVNEADLQEKVLEASSDTPVVVDFWAEWCGPCRALEPVLERVVDSYGGKLRLARVNVDDNPQLAQRYQVQGIPAVKVFADGQVMAEFVGAQPESEIRRILDGVVPSAADELVLEGDRKLEHGLPQEAGELYHNALAEQSDHPGALLRLGTLLLDEDRPEEAREVLSRIGEAATEYSMARGLLARLEFEKTCAENGGPQQCRERAEASPDDPQARYALACCLAAQERYKEALDELMVVLSQDVDFCDGAAREAVLRIFDLVGRRSELTDRYRRRMASIIY